MGCVPLCKVHRHQAIQISKTQSTPHFSGPLFPSSRRLRQHSMANFIKGNQSHVLFTTSALAEVVPDYVWASVPVPHQAWGSYQLTGSGHQQWWLNTLPETSNIGYQRASFHLSTAHSLELCAIYCVTSFSFLLIMRPLKWKVCLPSVISKDLTASLKVQRKLQPRT